MINAELLSLPWATVLFLASGYAGYFIANTGMKERHKNIDIAFSSAVFGFFAIFLYKLVLSRELGELPSSAVGFAFALVCGAIWRRAGRPLMRAMLRTTHIAFTDDNPSALHSLFENRCAVTELAVQLKNGSWLQSCNLHRFSKWPNGPFCIGENGDVLMYVTDSRGSGEEHSKCNPSLEHEGWGMEITYIPASEIARIEIRRLSPTS